MIKAKHEDLKDILDTALEMAIDNGGESEYLADVARAQYSYNTLLWKEDAFDEVGRALQQARAGSTLDDLKLHPVVKNLLKELMK